MEISKSFQVCSDYKDSLHRTTWEIFQFAEVLFVDKVNPSSNPLLYQLSNSKLYLEEILTLHKTIPLNFSHDNFVLLGEVLFINKKKKQVTLVNHNKISYNHLVIGSGKKLPLFLQSEELLAALQTLTDALRLKPKIPDSFSQQKLNSSILTPKKQDIPFAASNKIANNNEEQNIDKFVHPFIQDAESHFKSSNLDSNRFYEVQI
jgi:hypothetical protein